MMKYDPCQCKVCDGLRRKIHPLEMTALLRAPRWNYYEASLERYDDDW